MFYRSKPKSCHLFNKNAGMLILTVEAIAEVEISDVSIMLSGFM